MRPYMAGVEDGSAFIIYHNVLGSYALKYQADYTGALTHYLLESHRLHAQGGGYLRGSGLPR